jgi:protein TonB
MSRDWQISIIVSLLCHLLLLQALATALSQPVRLPGIAAVDVSLVAARRQEAGVAVAPPAAEPARTPAAVRRPEPPPRRAVVKRSHLPAPRPSPAQEPTAPPAPGAAAVGGDGSSAEPGRDPTTARADAGVLARPSYRKNPEPAYPASARRRRQEGLVLLRVEVTAEGRASRVDLAQSSGSSALDQAALDAVRSWEFEPARRGARAIASEIEVPVRFRLTD